MLLIFFNQACHLKRHTDIYCTEITESYNGGKLKPAETIFDWLEKEGYNVPEKDRFYPFFSVFDYESIQEKKEENIKGRFIKYTHVPASFSICSNIPGHTEAVHVVSDGNSQKLVDKMVLNQLQHQKTSSSIMRKKFSPIFDKLQSEINYIQDTYPDIMKKMFFNRENPICKRYSKTKS